MTERAAPATGPVVGIADLGALAAIVVAVVAAYLLDGTALSDDGRTGVAVLLALVPPLAWLVLFYQRDHLEPEPKHYVIAVAVLAGLIAAAVGEPLLDLFDRGAWFGDSFLGRLAGGVLVVGMIREVATYAAIRFSIFGSPEFDDAVDGLVYGTAAGLGYATAVNLAFVIDASGADLGPAMIRIGVFSLAYASLGGLIGVFLAQYRYEGRPAWWPAAGVAVAALLGGVLFMLRNEITTGVGAGLTSAGQWGSLLLAALLAAVLTFLLLVTAHRPARAVP